MAELELIPRIAALYELQNALLQPVLSKVGITQHHFQLIAAIHSAGKQASQIEVARRLGITAPTLSESVQAAIRLGLVSQEPSIYDRRVKTLRLTKEATRLLSKIVDQMARTELTMTSGLTATDIKVANRVLDHCLERLEDVE